METPAELTIPPPGHRALPTPRCEAAGRRAREITGCPRSRRRADEVTTAETGDGATIHVSEWTPPPRGVRPRLT
ncbi:hypothetical protein GCM10023097_16660 [Streptomyces collinus]